MNLSKSYLPAIEKGIHATPADRRDCRVPLRQLCAFIVYDGKEHRSLQAGGLSKSAGREAFKLAGQGCQPVLFEPIMNGPHHRAECQHGRCDGRPEQPARRRVQGTEEETRPDRGDGQVPLAEMLALHHPVRSITGGRGVFTMEFDAMRWSNHLAQRINRDPPEGSGSQEGRVTS